MDWEDDGAHSFSGRPFEPEIHLLELQKSNFNNTWSQNRNHLQKFSELSLSSLHGEYGLD